MDVLIVAAVGFLLVALLFGFMYRAMRDRSFGRNRAIGIRTRATLASDEAWARGHRASAPWVLSTAIVALVCGLAAVTLAFAGVSDSNVAVAVVLLGGFGSIIGCLVASAVVADRAATASP